MAVLAAVAIGSNLGDRVAWIVAARDRVARIPGVEPGARSSIYETEPVGPPQGEFLNAVDLYRVRIAPEAFLEELLAVERALGRVREERWGPRTIDLDLLFHGDPAMRTPRLTLPHPEIPNRSFVLVPLAEVAPDWIHPTIGRTPGEMIASLRAASKWSAVRRLEAEVRRGDR